MSVFSVLTMDVVFFLPLFSSNRFCSEIENVVVGCAGIAQEDALKKSFWDLFGVDGSQDQVNLDSTLLSLVLASKVITKVWLVISEVWGIHTV